MVDIEQSRQHMRGPPPSTALPANHPLNIAYRILVIIASSYGLNDYGVFHEIMRGPNVSHEWFKVCLASGIALFGVKAYLEMYEGKLKKKKVEYQNYKNATHAALLLWSLASFAFNKALWGEYGIKTLFLSILVGYGIILQFMLLVPTWVQNVVGFIGLTFFLQQYQ